MNTLNQDFQKLFANVAQMKGTLTLQLDKCKDGRLRKKMERELQTLKDVSSILASIQVIGVNSILALPVVKQKTKDFCYSFTSLSQLQPEQIIELKKLKKLIHHL